MTNPVQAEGMIASAFILLAYWLLVFSIPFVILAPQARENVFCGGRVRTERGVSLT